MAGDNYREQMAGFTVIMENRPQIYKGEKNGERQV